MAETNVPITAGSGTNIATFTDTAGNRRQIVMVGDATSNTAPVDNTKGLAVDLTNTGQNTTAIKVDGSGVTQPVSGSFAFTPATSGGLLMKHVVAAASTNATSVKASAGQLYGVRVFNNATYPIYVKFHNTASTPTAGSGVVLTVGVQAGTQRDVAIVLGSAFSTGIGITIVKGIADADTTAVAAADCVVDLDYF